MVEPDVPVVVLPTAMPATSWLMSSVTRPPLFTRGVTCVMTPVFW